MGEGLSACFYIPYTNTLQVCTLLCCISVFVAIEGENLCQPFFFMYSCIQKKHHRTNRYSQTARNRKFLLCMNENRWYFVPTYIVQYTLSFLCIRENSSSIFNNTIKKYIRIEMETDTCIHTWKYVHCTLQFQNTVYFYQNRQTGKKYSN